MDYTLTKKYQFSKHCKDGKDRNYLLYFLNNVQIFRQKVPYDEKCEHGFDATTSIYGEYIHNGYLYQLRQKDLGMEPLPNPLGVGVYHREQKWEIRSVKFPLSEAKLKTLRVPSDTIIKINENRKF